MLDRDFPELAYVETRDADDEMGTTRFLHEVVGQLEADEGLAYVQTIKETQVSAGDPFNNRESLFFRGQMLGRNAANSVFPCGSGVVWRRTALRSIGEFPVWNLVEDLQSGFEALKRGWRGMYLPIVGAVGQHSPEDVPNVYKQRGTWASTPSACSSSTAGAGSICASAPSSSNSSSSTSTASPCSSMCRRSRSRCSASCR